MGSRRFRHFRASANGSGRGIPQPPTPWRRPLSTAVSPGPRAPELGSGLRSLHQIADDALAERVCAGDARAFEVLYDRHRAEISRYCSAIVRHPQDAEEALQLTMLCAYRALSAGTTPRIALRPWLFRIAHNECVNLMRSRPRVEELTDRHDPVAGALHERVEAREALRELNDDIAALPLRQRAAFVLHELSGLPHAAVGEAIGTTALGARQLLHEARTTLEEFRAGRGLDCSDVRVRIAGGDRRILRGRGISAHLRGCAACGPARPAAPARRPLARRLLVAATAVVVAGMVVAGVRAFAAPAGTAPDPASATARAVTVAPSPALPAPAPVGPAASPASPAAASEPAAPAVRFHDLAPPPAPATPVAGGAPAPPAVAAPAPVAAPPAPADPVIVADPVTDEPSGLAAAPEAAPPPAPPKDPPSQPAPPVEPSAPTPAPTPGGEQVPEEPGSAPIPGVGEIVPPADPALTAAP